MFRFWPFILIFCSGLAALSYQMIWMREFRLIFGASTAATAAVSAIFMAGLGLGGWLLGPKADKHKQPLLLYGYLELAISIFAFLFPILLYFMRTVYLKSGGILDLGLVGGTAARLGLAVIVIGIPTFLMGGTLPAVARVVTAENDSSRLSLGTLYGINTIGALFGTLLTTFFILEAFGARQTLYLAAGINIIVALIAISLAKKNPVLVLTTDQKPLAVKVENKGELPAAMALTAAAVVGFAFFLMELVWYRMLGPVLGGSVYTFGLILATALAGIGIGGALHPVLFRKRAPSVWYLAATCLLEALAFMVPYALGDYIPLLASQTRSIDIFGFWGLVTSWSVITFIVVFPASIIAGIQFPLLISLLGKGDKNIGRQTGLTYACNTGGSILGSLAGGFGLMPWLTAPGCWRLSGGLVTLLGVVLIVYALHKMFKERNFRFKYSRVFIFAIIVVVTIACFTALGPTAAWRHSAIGSGRVQSFSSINDVRNWNVSTRCFTIWEADGVESAVAIYAANGYSFIVNGKADGHVLGDRGTQIMVGLIGSALHPEPRRAMVVGLGTGCSAGWLAEVPGMEHVDVVELEPAILHMADLCAPANYNVLGKAETGQGVRILINDAREVLNTIKAKYDLVVSEPSNPYRAGIASLYTKEFYTEVASRLNEGGIFISWCQAYEIETVTAFTVAATLKSVFPYVECWSSQYGDLVFAASMQPINPDLAALSAKLNAEPYKEAMRVAWGTEGVHGFMSHYLANNEFVDMISKTIHPANINTDDLMLVEYAYATTVGKTTDFSVEKIRAAAEIRGMDLPQWALDSMDKEDIYDTLAGYFISYGYNFYRPTQVSDNFNRYMAALDAWRNNNTVPLINYWKDLERTPVNSIEIMALAEGLAKNGDEQALRLLDGQEKIWPASTAMIKALLAYKKQQFEEAVTEMEQALLFLRSSPWEIQIIIERGLQFAVDLAEQGTPEQALQLWNAMDEPFMLFRQESGRRTCLLAISQSISVEKTQATLLRWFEPNPIWDENLLILKNNIYSVTGHPQLEKARRDLELYYSAESISVDKMLILNN